LKKKIKLLNFYSHEPLLHSRLWKTEVPAMYCLS